MSEVDVLIGEFIRMLMVNQRKSITTKKHEIKQAFKLDNKHFDLLIEATLEYLKKMSIELIGVCKDGVIEPGKADKFFLRKIYKENLEDSNLRIEDSTLNYGDFKRLIIIFSVLSIENIPVSYGKIEKVLRQLNVIDEEDSMIDILKFYKSMGYINYTTVDEEPCIVFGWRYYSDFSNFKLDIFFTEANLM